MTTTMLWMLELDHLTSKQCTTLQKTLLTANQIINQGANDIMSTRHDTFNMQNEHRRRRILSQRKPSGQQLITTWL